MGQEPISTRLLEIFNRLLARYGPQHWWPAGEPFEVIVGAILTQSAAWVNVEKAIARLKQAGALSPEALRRLSEQEVAQLIHSCGYYNSKAKKLKVFAHWFGENYHDNLEKLFNNSIESLRSQLLSVYGIGAETADSIILYVGNKPVFVIDAYTRRILDRLDIAPSSKGYAGYQALFMRNLPADARLFNEYHALLVHLGKNLCRAKPRCGECCLQNICGSNQRSWKNDRHSAKL